MILPPNEKQEAGFNADERLRYSRHFLLPEIGMEGQGKLKSARVLCLGAGGLGSPAALYLAAAGVGTIGLVDFDRVELSNLQRQLLHGTADVGRMKAESARDRIKAANPNVEVRVHACRFESGNAEAILRDYDLVIDGSDNFATRYLTNDVAVFARKPCVYGSIFRFDGQATVFAPHLGGACYRCVFPEPPDPGAVPSCAEAGVLGVLPGGAQAHPRSGRNAPRPTAAFRCAEDEIPRIQSAARSRVPGLRRHADDHRADRL
jgi:adenylyltransferase/sulfurtransferase